MKGGGCNEMGCGGNVAIANKTRILMEIFLWKKEVETPGICVKILLFYTMVSKALQDNTTINQNSPS
jgi:hypothetical protein